MRSRRWAAGGFAFVLLAAACGGHSGIDRQASDQLASAVAQVRAAARAHDVSHATARLGDVRRMVVLLRARGDLSDARARRILAAADEVGSDLQLIPTTTTSTSTTVTSTTTNPSPPSTRKDHHGHGGNNGDNGDNGN